MDIDTVETREPTVAATALAAVAGSQPQRSLVTGAKKDGALVAEADAGTSTTNAPRTRRRAARRLTRPG
jgi:hypothetical protein